MVSFLIRLRCLNQAIDLLELYLAAAKITPDQFVLLDNRLQSLESNLVMEPAIQGESTIQFTTLENIGHPEVRKALGAEAALSSSNELISLSPGKTKLARWGAWSYLPELIAINAFQKQGLGVQAWAECDRDTIWGTYVARGHLIQNKEQRR